MGNFLRQLYNFLQGSLLSPILFNIFFGVLAKEFEKRCTLHSTEETILGVSAQYNLADGFMDDKQIRRQKPGMRTATVVDVLYADDCVAIRAIQLMIVVQFDEVSILFGMEFAISMTKIVCNQYSKAMELEARDKEDGHAVVEVATYDTRGSRVLARI